MENLNNHASEKAQIRTRLGNHILNFTVALIGGPIIDEDGNTRAYQPDAIEQAQEYVINRIKSYLIRRKYNG